MKMKAWDLFCSIVFVAGFLFIGSGMFEALMLKLLDMLGL